MTISWIILTYNRGGIVSKSVTHNFQNAGLPPDELIWVDNGSTDTICREFMMGMDPEVSVIYSENKGVARGYNTGMLHASCDYIVITGCDMLMPDNWLKTFKEYIDTIEETGIACIYSKTIMDCRDRLRGTMEFRKNLPYIKAMPIERRIFKRELLKEIGYFPETFGLYGYDDIAWAYRAENVLEEKGLISYVIPNMVAEHLGTEGIESLDRKDPAAYHAMKQKEAKDPAKKAELLRLKGLGWPKSNPFL